jgi:hypothetical protein
MGMTLNYEPSKKETAFKPGPGSYEHEKLKTMNRSAAWGIGKEKR